MWGNLPTTVTKAMEGVSPQGAKTKPAWLEAATSYRMQLLDERRHIRERMGTCEDEEYEAIQMKLKGLSATLKSEREARERRREGGTSGSRMPSGRPEGLCRTTCPSLSI
eukprot:891979-Pyramimonas_sp.AAC.1